jgi:predicted small secreted protein
MKSIHQPTLIVLGLSFLALLAFNGCNTARGFGQDVQKTGEKIENKASR